MATFGSLVNRVARDLPEGYEITISLEQGSGVVSLQDPFGEDLEFPSNYESIENITTSILRSKELCSESQRSQVTQD